MRKMFRRLPTSETAKQPGPQQGLPEVQFGDTRAEPITLGRFEAQIK